VNVSPSVPAGTEALVPPGYAVDALMLSDSMRWNYPGAIGTGVELTYSFLQSVPSYYDFGSTERNRFQAFSASEADGARRALEQFSDVANITFLEVGDVGAIAFGTALFDSSYQAYAYYPSLSQTDRDQGDIWLNNYWSNNEDQHAGDYGFLTLMHEIGHAVGLKHSFDASWGPVLPTSEENRLFSIMSYSQDPFADVEPSTLMLYDIAAVQHLYGANYSTRSGNTYYSWDRGAHIVETIWDGGGYDTIDASNQGAAAVIDLREGSFSSIGGLSRNIAIAFGVTIEDAVGGTGDDRLIGNNAANQLTGGLGRDYLDGRNGTDTALYATSTVGVRVDLLGHYGRFGQAEGDTLISIENVVGSRVSDELWGDAADNWLYGLEGNDSLRGDSGDDMLVGGPGSDILTGGTGFDSATYHNSDSGIRIDLLDKRGTGGDAAGDLYGSIEEIIASRYDDLIVGDNANNVFWGLEGRDDLLGDTGNDRIDGGPGDDRLWGGTGDDVLIGGPGADVLTGGPGRDTAVYTSSNHAVTVNLALGTGLGGHAEGDLLGSIEGIAGSSYDDVLVGDSAVNELDGGAGSDTLIGGGGRDVFIFQRAETQGDVIEDFVSGFDSLRFVGFGSNAAFEPVIGDTSSWQVATHDRAWSEVIHFSNGMMIAAGDFTFA
jgi:serralysin